MSVRSSVLILAAVAIVGGAAFYTLGASQKVDATSSEVAATPDAAAESPNVQSADNELNGMAPAAGDEEAAASGTKSEANPADGTEAEASSAEEKPAAPAKSAEEVLKSHNLQLVYGKDDAPVKVIEYFSLSCPHCGEFYKDHQPQLIKDYVDTGKVQYLKRYFPHNAPGLAATMLMQCVAEEKKTQFLEALFSMQSKWAFSNEFKNDLKAIAEIGGIGPTDFDVCLADKSIEEKVLTQRQEALDSLKLEGIPAIFVNGMDLKGANYGKLTQAIDQALKSNAAAE